MKLIKTIRFLFFFLIQIFSYGTIGWSSDHQGVHDAPDPGASADNILTYFNSPERRGLLQEIARDTFHADKNNPEISQKICTHQPETLEWWRGKKDLKTLSSNA